jgi:hypothetical protein
MGPKVKAKPKVIAESMVRRIPFVFVMIILLYGQEQAGCSLP